MYIINKLENILRSDGISVIVKKIANGYTDMPGAKGTLFDLTEVKPINYPEKSLYGFLSIPIYKNLIIGDDTFAGEIIVRDTRPINNTMRLIIDEVKLELLSQVDYFKNPSPITNIFMEEERKITQLFKLDLFEAISCISSVNMEDNHSLLKSMCSMIASIENKTDYYRENDDNIGFRIMNYIFKIYDDALKKIIKKIEEEIRRFKETMQEFDYSNECIYI